LTQRESPHHRFALYLAGFSSVRLILCQRTFCHLLSFANTIDAHNPSDEYLFKVLDWVKYAFMNADGYSYESRLVMMATAFEVFFHLPRENKTRLLAERLESLLGVDNYDIYDNNYNVI
jgi:hypothetical protein